MTVSLEVNKAPEGFAKDLAAIEALNLPRQGAISLTQSRKPRQSLLDYDLAEMVELVKELGFPAFRAKQIWGWLYHKFAADYSEMTNLPRPLLEKLAARAPLAPLETVIEKVAGDGQTRKVLFRLPDGAEIESVLM